MTPAEEPVRARVLCDVQEAAAAGAADGAAGILWKLADAGRQLDANLVRLAPGARVPAHAEPDLDVLVLVVAGTGELDADPRQPRTPLAAGALVWLPHGATRGIAAGEQGLSYVTVHRRRPGMRIGRRPGA
jgi:quercetin dioxygenase-like cupin family protein